VDVSSGVEDAPGRKNRDKVARFLEEARAAYVAAGL
jgi:phosphoribosylanthranilate isomerase